MCGRFTLKSSSRTIAEVFGILIERELGKRYNISPGSPIVVLDRDESGRRLTMMDWGLLLDEQYARSEGEFNVDSFDLDEDTGYAEALEHGRCLIVADGFYKWSGMRNSRVPHYFQRCDGKPFAFAGISVKTQRYGRTCAIVTSGIPTIMHRTPIIMPPESYDRWLDPDTPRDDGIELLRPNVEGLTGWEVSRYVNDATHKSPKCIERVSRSNGPPEVK